MTLVIEPCRPNRSFMLITTSSLFCLSIFFRNDTTDSTVTQKLTICASFGYGYNYGLPQTLSQSLAARFLEGGRDIAVFRRVRKQNSLQLRDFQARQLLLPLVSLGQHVQEGVQCGLGQLPELGVKLEIGVRTRSL